MGWTPTATPVFYVALLAKDGSKGYVSDFPSRSDAIKDAEQWARAGERVVVEDADECIVWRSWRR